MINDEITSTEKAVIKFERGFKTWSENMSENFRIRLRMQKYSPLSPRDLYHFFNVTAWQIDQVPNLDQNIFNYLVSDEGKDEWSAVTVSNQNSHIIVYNNTHSLYRQNSDIMHELAHIIRNHKPAQVFYIEGLALRSYDELQELEANWLGFCMLFPKSAIMHCHYQGYSIDQISEKYGISKELIKFRVNVTGLGKLTKFK